MFDGRCDIYHFKELSILKSKQICKFANLSVVAIHDRQSFNEGDGDGGSSSFVNQQ